MSDITGGEAPQQDSATSSVTSGRPALDLWGRLRRLARGRLGRFVRPGQLGPPPGRRTRLRHARRLSGGQRRLTVVILLAPLLAWGSSLPAGAAFSPGTLTVVAILTLVTAIRPDSAAGLSTVLFLGWYWVTQVPTHSGGPVSAWTLGAGLSLLAFHTATAARATAPGRADLDRAFWQRWSRRVAIIAAATCGVWGLTVAMASQHPGRESLTLAALALLIGASACARWIVMRPTKT
jgi:hypothetical protein